MTSIFKNVIKWPTEDNIENIIHGFTCLKPWPYLDKVIGAIDGSHIKINPCVEHSDKYINRKKFYSLVLLGVVDANEKFTYVYTGEPGSVHDSRVLRRSSLWEQIILNKEK